MAGRNLQNAPRRTFAFGLALASIALVLACGETTEGPPAFDPLDAGVSLGDGAVPYVDAQVPDGDKPKIDGGYEAPDGGVLRDDRFVTQVVAFTPGACAGYGASSMPEVVLGPPVGAGTSGGGTDVVSLGSGGEIVVSFAPNSIVDGPGADFIVFENAFNVGGDPSRPFAELAEVAVSEDGETWRAFSCDPVKSPPFDACAGHSPVLSAPGNGISPVDPSSAGGDAYDLAILGLTTARFVRLRDRSSTPCPAPPNQPTNVGFDLDAVAIVNAALP